MASDQHTFDRLRHRAPGILAAVFAVTTCFIATAVHAQVPASSTMTQLLDKDPDARMLLEADQLVYDYDNDLVSAEGAVDIYYKDYTIEADRVQYDQTTGRVFALGNVKVTGPDGNVIYAETVELTDDFRDGFIEELTLVTTDETRFAATSAERFDDNVTVFNTGVYTACKPCREQPERPPFWQIKAKKIIHNQQEKIVYYEDATFELFGMPIAYLPYFSHPDPTVKRQSGFLRPNFLYDSELGYGVEVPYYFALAEDYDLTVSVTPYTIQGPLGEFEWRQRFEKGEYMIRGAGIIQQDPEMFEITSTGYRDDRGVLQTAGLFQINSFWKWGWHGTLQTDDTFMQTYNLTDATETRDQVFLTGQSARNWFDARVVHYQLYQEPPRANENAQPFIHPLVDYNYIFDQPVLGGRLSFDMNALSLTRTDAEFLPLFPFAKQGDPMFGCPYRYLNNPTLFYGLNPNRVTNLLANATPDRCDLVGAPGSSNRFISEASWERTFTDGIGQVFKPFVSLRGDIYSVSVDDPYLTGFPGLTTGVIDRFLPTGDDTILRGMAAVGVEYRYPILISDDWGYQIIEPIGQIIARPDATDNDIIPNDDALSLVFDDTNLFEIDKFSGYDRLEGGTRANLGIRYVAQFNGGVRFGGVFGQSYQLAGTNPFPTGSGLETDRSDYVAALYFSPISSLQIVNRIRLDEADFASKRYDLEVSGSYGPLTTSIIYSNIAADLQQGIDENREEIQGIARLQIDENWKIWAGGRYEISGTSARTFGEPEAPQWISNTFGFGYENECVTLALAYERRYVRDVDQEPDERIMFKFALRTLTEGSFKQSIGTGDQN